MEMTAGDIINAALRKCGGLLAEGETPSADMSLDALEALNTMLDSWSAERLSVFTTQDQVFTWPANTSSRTLGPSGNLVGLRPIQVEDSSYFKDFGTDVSYGLELISEGQYNGIAWKVATSTFPQYMWVEPGMPDVTITLYPVPTRDLEFHFVSVAPLAEPAGLATSIVLPPGYKRALIFNLACEICPEYGLDPPTTVQRIAMTSKRVLKANNSPKDILSMPIDIMSKGARFNIYSGNV